MLAGSTMSQIGYMMLAAGIGPAGYAFAIFHLLTHGFFKADMFLGAGSVMHAMNDEVDMRHYGALRTLMPITFVTFAAGYLAIIGFPFFSGFYSKDHIIEVAFQHSAVVGGLALLGAGVTALLHDPADVDDVLRQEALAAGCPPARVTAGDDRALDLPGHRFGHRRLGAQQLDCRLARSRGRRRSARGATPVCSLLDDSASSRWSSSPSVLRSACGSSDHVAKFRSLSQRASRSSPWPAAMIFTAMPSTRPCSCDRGSSSPRAWCVSRIPGSTAR